MPRFTVADHSLHYELHGPDSAPALVLLHEGLGALSEYRPQIDFFSRHFRVLAFDRWGYGQSDPRERFTPGYLEADAEEAIALLDWLGLRDSHLLGHSDGGSIALLIAGRRPDLVGRLALEAAHIYCEPSMHAGLLVLRDKIRGSRRVRQHLENLHGPRGLALAEAWIDHWLDHERLAPRSDSLVPDQTLRQIRSPALVIQGIEDEYATEQHARDLHSALPGSALWLIPGIGHTPHRDLADAFNERVLRFCSPLAAPTGAQPGT